MEECNGRVQWKSAMEECNGRVQWKSAITAVMKVTDAEREIEIESTEKKTMQLQYALRWRASNDYARVTAQ